MTVQGAHACVRIWNWSVALKPHVQVPAPACIMAKSWHAHWALNRDAIAHCLLNGWRRRQLHRYSKLSLCRVEAQLCTGTWPAMADRVLQLEL